MVKIGLVGSGGMGTVHYTSFEYIEGVEVVALVGKGKQDLEKADAWGLPVFESISDMLSVENIDIVDICTPTFLHAQHVKEALQGKKNVICEKPLAMKSADAEELFKMANEARLHIYVGQVLQFYKESEILRELVRSGEYGKPLDAYFTRLSACPRWAQGGWMFDKEKSGLIPFDLHIHDLDLIISLFGVPKKHSFTSCGGADKPYKEQYRFSYAYENFNVVAEAGWLNADIPFTATWRVYFENAMVVNEGGRVIAYQFDKTPRIFDTEEKIKIPTGINIPPTGTFLAELSHFVDCYKKNRDSDIVTQKQILSVIQLLESIKV